MIRAAALIVLVSAGTGWACEPAVNPDPVDARNRVDPYCGCKLLYPEMRGVPQ